MTETFTQIVPVFRIFDTAKAKEFYVDFLGMRIDWEHRFAVDMPLYMQVSRGELTLHLSEHHGDCCPGGLVFVRMAGIEAFQQELLAKNYRYCKPGIDIAPWNAKVMQIVDPFGNKLRFSEQLAES